MMEQLPDEVDAADIIFDVIVDNFQIEFDITLILGVIPYEKCEQFIGDVKYFE